MNLEEVLKFGVFKDKFNFKNEYVLKKFIVMIGCLREVFEILVEKFCEWFLEEINFLKSYEKEDNYEEREGFVKEFLSLVKEYFKINFMYFLLDFLNESMLDVYNIENV